jgi:hypothetical protein
MENWLNIFPILLILAASVFLFIGENWRNMLIALAVIYFASFFLLLQVWPFTMAAAKLITGWMCVAILSFTTEHQPLSANGTGSLSRRVFLVMSLFMIWVAAYLLAGTISNQFQVGTEIAFSSFAVLGCGLLTLGMSSSTFRVILGILTFFSGFELLYAGLEPSILVNGLILIVNLLIAFVGSYLISLPGIGGEE